MKKTKRSLFTSLVTLLLCSAMFVGSTFAWFTDTVSNTGNRIQAGTLKVDLLMDKELDGNYTSIAGGKGDIFKEANVAQNSNETLWEPGKTQFAKLAVENKGNLALKYAAYIDVTDKGLCVGSESGKSSLEYAIVSSKAPIDITSYTNWEAVKAAVEASGGAIGDVDSGRQIINTGVLDEIAYDSTKTNEKDYVLLAVHMKEDAGNEYQGKDCVIDVNIVATQKNAESDAFGPDYDISAPFAIPSTPISKKLDTNEELKIVVPAEAQEQTPVKEATVPAAVANAVFEKVFTTDEESDKSLTLILNVDEKSKTETTFNYEIDMDAVIKEVKGAEVIKSETKSVNDLGLTFTDFVEIQMKVTPGLVNVEMKHNGVDMTQVTGKSDIPTEDQNSAGYFNYDSTTGNAILWTKTFSPFVLSGLKPAAMLSADGVETQYYSVTANGYWKNLLHPAFTSDDIASDMANKDLFVGKAMTFTLLEDVTLNDNKSLFNYRGSLATNSYSDFYMLYNKSTPYPEFVDLLNLTIDLNGHSITGNNSTAFNSSSETSGPGLVLVTTGLDRSFALTKYAKTTPVKYRFNVNIINTDPQKGGLVNPGSNAFVYVNNSKATGVGDSYYVSPAIVVNYSVYLDVSISSDVKVNGTTVTNATTSGNAQYVTVNDSSTH